MTVHPANANLLQTQTDAIEQANSVAAAGNNVSEDSSDNRHGAATTARQWQVLSQLQRNRWVGTLEPI